jgi:hypothetical protein
MAKSGLRDKIHSRTEELRILFREFSPKTDEEGEVADGAFEVLLSIVEHARLSKEVITVLTAKARKRKRLFEDYRSKKKDLKKLYNRVNRARKLELSLSRPSPENLKDHPEKNAFWFVSEQYKRNPKEGKKWAPTTVYDYYYNQAKPIFDP